MEQGAYCGKADEQRLSVVCPFLRRYTREYFPSSREFLPSRTIHHGDPLFMRLTGEIACTRAYHGEIPEGSFAALLGASNGKPASRAYLRVHRWSSCSTLLLHRSKPLV